MIAHLRQCVKKRRRRKRYFKIITSFISKTSKLIKIHIPTCFYGISPPPASFKITSPFLFLLCTSFPSFGLQTPKRASCSISLNKYYNNGELSLSVISLLISDSLRQYNIGVEENYKFINKFLKKNYCFSSPNF